MVRRSMLGQVRPSGTSPVVLVSDREGKLQTVETVVICNTSGSAATARVCHDDDGQAVSEATALMWDASIPASGVPVVLDVSLYLGLPRGGALMVRSSVGDALTFTAYGATEDES